MCVKSQRKIWLLLIAYLGKRHVLPTVVPKCSIAPTLPTCVHCSLLLLLIHTNTYLSCSQLIILSRFGQQPPRCGSRERKKKTHSFSWKLENSQRLNIHHPGLLLCKGHLAKKNPRHRWHLHDNWIDKNTAASPSMDTNAFVSVCFYLVNNGWFCWREGKLMTSHLGVGSIIVEDF